MPAPFYGWCGRHKSRGTRIVSVTGEGMLSVTTASPAGSIGRAVAPRRLHATIVLSLLLSLAGSIFVATPRSAEAAAAWTTTALNLRAGPSTGDAVILVMPAGAPVNIVRNVTNGFYKVHYNGTAGWASAQYVARSDPGGGSAPPPTNGGGNGATGNATVNTNGLNLRSGPGTNNSVILVMPQGASVTLTGETSNGFAALTYNGTSGWAASWFLSGGGSAPPSNGGNDGGGPSAGPTGSATVNTNGLNLRSSASTSSGVLAVMPNGAGVTLTGQRQNGFLSVTYNGQSGWAYESYLSIGSTPAPNPSPSPSPSPNTPSPGSGLAYTTTSLNLRSGASTNNSVLAVMPSGAEVQLTGVAQSGFYQVVYNGTTGWASTQYLTLGGNPNPNPNPNPGNGGLRGDTDGSGSLSQQEIIQIIYTAADQYGQPRDDMLRVARCESVLDPNAVNPAGSYGLFQFVPSTWASTPFADEDIFDAYASANAAGWMWSVGRRNEWVCQ
jgi:uncharacterized protein YraI